MDVRKLGENFGEGFLAIAECTYICFSDVVLSYKSFLEYAIVIYHVPCLKESPGGCVLNHSANYEVDVLGTLACFCDWVPFGKFDLLQFFKVFGIEVVVSILQKLGYVYNIVIHELCKFCFQRGREYLEQIGNFFIGLDLQFLLVS